MSSPAFFKSFDAIVNQADYTEDASAFSGFGMHTTGGGVRITHLGGGGDIFFSFTGQEDHGVVSPSGRTEIILEGVRANQIYLRSVAGTGSETVEVSAWTRS